MQAFVVRDPHEYGLVAKPQPVPGPDQAVVGVRCCAICASDFEVLYGVNEEEVVYPITPGHEWSGEVIDAGCNMRHWLGRRVTGDNAVGCGRCPPCQRGQIHICHRKQELGFSLDGAYAETLLIPGRNLIELPPTLEFHVAALAEPLAVCLHALRLAQACPDRATLILGDGPIGVFTVLLAHRLGCRRLLVAGHHPHRLDLLAEWTGAGIVNTHEIPVQDACRDHFGGSADLVFETTGHAEVIRDGLAALERGGDLCLIGCYRDRLDLNPNDLVLFEQSLIGSVSYCRSEMEQIVAWLGDGLLNGRPVVTHRFALQDYETAFRVVENREDHVIKACFRHAKE